MPAMNQEEIAKLFENAPEGATHYNDVNNMFYMFRSSAPWQFWSASRKEWREAGSLDEHSFMFERPAAWIGEGLPPIGTTCQMTHEAWGNRGWEQVKILYISAEYAITTDGHSEQHWHIRNVTFRPIRTPEQIAAEKREAAITELREVISNAAKDDAYGWLAAELHDAGYRKTEGGAK